MSQDASRALVSATPERTTIEPMGIPAPSGWQQVLDAFLNTMDSAATKREYRRDVESAMGVLGDLERMTAVVLTEYRDHWVSRLNQDSRDHLSPSSVMRHLAAVRSFLRFARLTAQSNLPDEVIRFALKSPRATVLKPYQVLTEEEKALLVAAAKASPRDCVLLPFVLATGLRASEVCALQVRDLSLDSEGDLMVHVRQGKGRKDRIVPLARETGKMTRSYLGERKIKIGRERDADTYLFPSRQASGHMTTSRLRQIVCTYLVKAGLNDKVISPHSLRHSAAITWLRGGASVVAVQKLLGHASLATTQKYVDHLGLRDLKKVVNHPLTKSKARRRRK